MLAVLFLGFIIVTQLLVTLVIFIESRRTKKSEQRLFALISFTTILWTICNVPLVFVDTAGTASNIGFYSIINKLAFSLATFSLVQIYYFSFHYPIRKQFKRLQRSILVLGLLLTAAGPLHFVSGTFKLVDGKIVYEAGILSALIAIFALITVFDIIFDDTRIFRSQKDPRLKRQAITLLMGLSLTVGHGVVFTLILPALIGQSPLLYAIGYGAPYYFVIFTVYGLLKQGLFDIRLIVARSIAYVLSLGTIIAVYSLLIFGLLNQFIDTISSQTVVQIFYILVAIFLALTYQQLKRFFDRFTNRLFYRDAYEPQVLLDQLNKVLVSTIDLDKLLKQSSTIIGTTLKAEFCFFTIYAVNGAPQRDIGSEERHFGEEHDEVVRTTIPDTKTKVLLTDELPEEYRKLRSVLIKNDAAVIVRLTNTPNQATEGTGYLTLGRKKSGNPYSQQDVKILEIIADEMVIAIQNALRFEEIQNFAATLQAKVDEATRKLRRTNEKLKTLDETKDEFISMASHQLRTPLTSVKGYVSMVLEGDAGKLTPMQRKLLDQSFVSSQRMVYLIADLLNVSRLRTGKFIIEAKPTNLADLVQGEIAQLKETAKSRGLELIYEKPDNFPVLMLDETKTRQVVMNFIDNAIYYTPKGGHITIELVDKPGSVEYHVSDDGIGVPKTEQHHLFTKFYRAGNARKARPDGTGLGLFMAKKVIVAQGGAIIFKSEEGKGSTFGFSFPKANLQTKEKAAATK